MRDRVGFLLVRKNTLESGFGHFIRSTIDFRNKCSRTFYLAGDLEQSLNNPSCLACLSMISLCGIKDCDIHRKSHKLYWAGMIFQVTTYAHLLLPPHIFPLTHVSISITDSAWIESQMNSHQLVFIQILITVRDWRAQQLYFWVYKGLCGYSSLPLSQRVQTDLKIQWQE